MSHPIGDDDHADGVDRVAFSSEKLYRQLHAKKHVRWTVFVYIKAVVDKVRPVCVWGNYRRNRVIPDAYRAHHVVRPSTFWTFCREQAGRASSKCQLGSKSRLPNATRAVQDENQVQTAAWGAPASKRADSVGGRAGFGDSVVPSTVVAGLGDVGAHPVGSVGRLDCFELRRGFAGHISAHRERHADRVVGCTALAAAAGAVLIDIVTLGARSADAVVRSVAVRDDVLIWLAGGAAGASAVLFW